MLSTRRTDTGSGSGNHSFPLHLQRETQGGNPNPHPGRLNPVLVQESPAWTSPAPHTDVGLASGMWGSGFGPTPTPLKYKSRVCRLAKHKCSWEKCLKVLMVAKSSLP